MERMEIEIRGPISQALYDRLRRRFVRHLAVPAAVAGTIGAVALLDPSLEGLWEGSDGGLVRIYQVGRNVTAVWEQTGTLSFKAVFVSSDRLEGTLYGQWEDIEPGHPCFEDVVTDPSFTATVDWDERSISQRWTAWLNHDTCERSNDGDSRSTLNRFFWRKEE